MRLIEEEIKRSFRRASKRTNFTFRLCLASAMTISTFRWLWLPITESTAQLSAISRGATRDTKRFPIVSTLCERYNFLQNPWEKGKTGSRSARRIVISASCSDVYLSMRMSLLVANNRFSSDPSIKWRVSVTARQCATLLRGAPSGCDLCGACLICLICLTSYMVNFKNKKVYFEYDFKTEKYVARIFVSNVRFETNAMILSISTWPLIYSLLLCRVFVVLEPWICLRYDSNYISVLSTFSSFMFGIS